jgi:integral membrane protein
VNARWTDEVTQFRAVSLLEGVSYLLLLGVAVPVKYLLHEPALVRVLGRVHGGLFVLFVLALVRAAAAAEWKASRSITAFVASVLPFGAFWFERKLRAEAAASPRA